jgi:hypothetical protein
MDKRRSLLTKMADKLLQSTDKAEAFEKSRQRSEKLKRLHDAISQRYKFRITRHESVADTEVDAAFLKLVQKTLTLTWSQETQLEKLFFKYNVK